MSRSAFKELGHCSGLAYRVFDGPVDLKNQADRLDLEGRRWSVVIEYEELAGIFNVADLESRFLSQTFCGFILILANIEDPIQPMSYPILGKIGKSSGTISLRELLGNRDRHYQYLNRLNLNELHGYSLKRLNEIFLRLSQERDPRKLLQICLEECVKMTDASTGLLYQVEDVEGELVFIKKFISDYFSWDVECQETHIKVLENSLCGYVVLTGKTLMSLDPSETKFGVPCYHRNIDVNDAHDVIRTLLTIPVMNRDKRIIAIIQLANKRSTNLKPIVFTNEDEHIVLSLATQTATCLESVQLYEDVQKLFDGFVKASISAIESRDPSTGGHSERVARLSVALAQATNDCSEGVYRSVKFRKEEMRELEYAALLHDFGKIGVREEVLVKAKKLYPYQLAHIQERVRLALAILEANYYRSLHQQHKMTEEEFISKKDEIKFYWTMIQKLNEPGSILTKDEVAILEKIKNEKFILEDLEIALLTSEEFEALCIREGSLTESERLEIESHVRHTYQYLKMIPWTRDFRHLTEIAYCHHEKLDGSGYPRGLFAHEIPLQSKIITIADIYDALTSADRWYKEAMPPSRALEILRGEALDGKIDPVLFGLFVEKKIYLLTQLEVREKTGT